MDIFLNKKNTWMLIVFASIVAVLNSWLYDSLLVGGALVIAEILILMWLFINKQYAYFLGMYVIFMAPCMEFGVFLQNDIVNIKELRVFGVNLGIVVLLPAIALGVIYYIRYHGVGKRCTLFVNIGNYLVMINIIALLIGLLNILMNDNQVRSMKQYASFFINSVYEMVFLPVGLYFVVYLVVCRDGDNLRFLENSLYVIVIALSVQVIVSSVLGLFAVYGGAKIIRASVATSLLPFGILLGVKKKNKLSKVSSIVSLIANVVLIAMGASGKLIITEAMVGVIWLLCILKGGKKRFVIAVIMLIPIVGLGIICFNYFMKSQLFRIKLANVQLLLQFGNGWLERLPIGPRVRVGEILNVFLEFKNKPWYLVTGKGFLGTVKDYSGLFINRIVSLDAFSDEQWDNGTFYSMHEFIQWPLTYGLLGTSFVFHIIKVGLKNLTTNVWLLLGAYWLLMFYGYSMTLSSLGIISLYYGLVSQSCIILED